MIYLSFSILNARLTRHFILQVEVNEISALYSNQEETDTRVVLYLHYATTLGYKDAVVRSPDTDIFMILLYHAHTMNLTIYLDTGTGKHRKVVNITELTQSLGEDCCATLLGFYVFTGEDCTRSFKGKENVGPLKENQGFHAIFRQLLDGWNVKPHVLKQLKQFTCLMYKRSHESSVDVVRAKLLRKMVGKGNKLTSESKVNLAGLSPCYSALKPHIHRVNPQDPGTNISIHSRFWALKHSESIRMPLGMFVIVYNDIPMK